ncbi:uncharacterized protein EKO05_0010769 [Ascochyta rabiei]|uniref:Uncharacterized protein n=1 Tax=Didymella rabiei TaxID=5454 RepID=A0A163K8V2_DIDRA|nr:uncharacterized protein EKO05_0010769 [Ascochyta rabiei]KZM26853.1 hypothetical protein ST47_g2024 [Ascochyta rabiei]UPX20540.1 hypothetical protein EKO05_0010769 [Ascochyta rabiei]
MDKINFNECANNYRNNATLQGLWVWNGTIIGIERNQTTQISREGCRHVCGDGIDYYAWKDASGTITTWILPFVGTLLQAPFESNETRRTLLAITRWVGSPIASLSYVLWNIKVSAKAALMVDMAVEYDKMPELDSHFGSMRDSMYLLLAMNQYTLKDKVVSSSKKAEGLLRIVLFSKDLTLPNTEETLDQKRRILARELREMRRRGAVPVFVSIMWFLFAFALSVQSAFVDLGENTTAHDLALGCLLAWFPILIMGSIVDRNPIAAEAIRVKLNALVDHVRHALRDERHCEEFINSFHGLPNFKGLKAEVVSLAKLSTGGEMKDFFEGFAGQGRVRWHYGAAHPILSDIETCYIAERGRNWLANEAKARASLVAGRSNDEGLVWFDLREFWQVASAVIIVGASCGGAFILSYFTPTVGLGCRSGGYTIFFSVSLGLLIVEMTVWLFLSQYKNLKWPWDASAQWRFPSNGIFREPGTDAHQWNKLKGHASRFLLNTKNLLIETVPGLTFLDQWMNKMSIKLGIYMDGLARRREKMGSQRQWEIFFFRPVEIFNTIWLVYIVLAQTFGWYKTCDCVTSHWGGAGGYLDFSVQNTSNSKWVLYYWSSGTALTASIMFLAMFYVTVEWCQQSFLSTEKYEEAMQGLRRTRSYRHFTYLPRLFTRVVTSFTLNPRKWLVWNKRLNKAPPSTILWTKDHTDRSTYPKRTSVAAPRQVVPPSFEVSDYSTVHSDNLRAQETHALMDSASPLATPPGRSRTRSDTSIRSRYQPESDYRISNDSNPPLSRSLPEAHHARYRADSRSSEEHRLSGEQLGVPTSPHNQSASKGWPGFSAALPPHAYTHVSSDPGSPLFDPPRPDEDRSGMNTDRADLEMGTWRRT